MTKTTQVMKLNVLGVAYVCTFTPSRTNPFRLYKTWYEHGTHRKQIAEYANFEGVLYHLLELRIPEFHKDWFGDLESA